MVTESGPHDWKKANAIPIFTKGKDDAGNYRPVMFTPVSGVIKEQVFWKPFQVM